MHLQFIQIGLLCLEGVDGLARKGPKRVSILDLTPMRICARRRVDVWDSDSVGSVRDQWQY